MTSDIVDRLSALFGGPGLHVVRGIVGDAMGDLSTYAEAVETFIQLSQGVSPNLDMTLGTSSTLLGCALLHRAGAFGDIDLSGLAAFGDQVARAVWARLSEYKPAGEAAELLYMGISHGWAGILYATLLWCETSRSLPPPGIRDRLGELAACGEALGRGTRWPVQRGPGVAREPSGYTPGWCHGSAGYVALWLAAHRVLGDSYYADLAEQAAWNCWEDADVYPSLCCGLAGRAYSLISLSNASGEAAWLRRARELAERAAAGRPVIPGGLEHSLYKGELGIGTLLADLDRPETARFPFFEVQT